MALAIFISGAGCWEQGVIGVGAAGDRLDRPGRRFRYRKPQESDHKTYASNYTHDGEIGQAGYWVRLTSYGGIDAEATARTVPRPSASTFSQRSGDGHVLVNVGQANERHSVIGSVVDVVGDRVVEGKAGDQELLWRSSVHHLVPHRVRPSVQGAWHQGRGRWPPVRGTAWKASRSRTGAWLTFDLAKGQSVTAVSAISHVDAEGARINLRADGMQDGARSVSTACGCVVPAVVA